MEASIRLTFAGGNEPEQNFEAKQQFSEPREAQGERRVWRLPLP